ncbi:MAG: hypothetical protein WAV50_03690 [Minisyncoccia bacterium]
MRTNPEFFSIGNAAGTCNSLAHFELMLKSAAATITVGPMSVFPRAQNAGNNAYQDREGNTINSMGLPNGGRQSLRHLLPEMIQDAADAGKTLALTVPPIKREDPEILAQDCADLRVPIVEINGGCINVWDDGVQKIPVSYDPKELKRTLGIFNEIAGRYCRLRIKLSPYLPSVPEEIADAIRPYDIEVVSCNTASAIMFTDDGRYAIEYGEHIGGYGGKAMKPIALRQMLQLRKLLLDHHLIGVSGIDSGRDVWEFMKVGANETQIGSAWWFTENARLFGRVLEEYTTLIEKHPL